MNKAACFSVFVMMVLVGLKGLAMDVSIEWDPALTTVEGISLDHVHCYKVFYSDTSGVYSNFVVVDDTRAVVTNLEFNSTMYFSVKTCTTAAESDFSEELVWNAPVMPDADGDGLSDEWEQEFFQTLDASPGEIDSDLDGVSDRAEFLAGTNPLDLADYPAVAIHVDAAGASVTFEARQAVGSGYENRVRTYTLQQCDDLSNGVWTDVAGAENIEAVDQLVSCAVTPGAENVFYRTAIRLD